MFVLQVGDKSLTLHSFSEWEDARLKEFEGDPHSDDYTIDCNECCGMGENDCEECGQPTDCEECNGTGEVQGCYSDSLTKLKYLSEQRLLIRQYCKAKGVEVMPWLSGFNQLPRSIYLRE